MAELEDLRNRTLGEFILRERIGEGGFAVVYRCDQPLLGRQAVVKVLKRRARRHDLAVQRFQREVQLAALFDHHYAAHVYASGTEADGLLWIAMELVDGVTLKRWLTEHGPMPLEQFVLFFERVAEVVDAAHERGIIHRDLKPSNVMVIKRAGRLSLKLLDFGVAKVLGEVLPQATSPRSELPVIDDASLPEDDTATDPERTMDGRKRREESQPQHGPYRLTPAGAAIGSPQYMAPEQWTNAMAAGPTSDLYSLAIVAYEALTGHRPFDAKSEVELGELHRCAPVPPLGEGFSSAFDTIFTRALAKQPEDRFQSALEFSKALQVATEEWMLARIRSAAQLWHERGRPSDLLWRGNVLAELESWEERTGAGALAQTEREFAKASRQHEAALAETSRQLAEASRRRRAWARRGGLALGVAIILTVAGVLLDRASLQARMNERIAVQAEVEQGRQALLHDDLAEAQQHLTAAYRRGDRSPAVTFMLARATDPLRAELGRLPASSGRMWSAAWSPDGRRIATADDRAAQIWDAVTYRLLATLPHSDTVYHASFSADGSKVVTACGDGAVRLWDVGDGALIRELRASSATRGWYLAAIAGTHVAAIDGAGAVAVVWDAGTGAVVAELVADGSEWPSLAFSSDGRWLAMSGGDDVRVLDTGSLAVVTMPGLKTRAIAWDPIGPRLLTGSTDGQASIWEIPTGRRLRHQRDVGDPVDAVAWSPDGRLLALGSRDGAEQVFDAATGRLMSQVRLLRGKITTIEFDAESRMVAAGGASGAIAVTEANTGLSVTTIDASRSWIRAVRFAPRSRSLLTASVDGVTRVWTAESPYRRWNAPPIRDGCGVVTSLDPDGRFLAIPCRDVTHVWDTARDLPLGILPGATPPTRDREPALPAISADGALVAIARNSAAEVYEVRSGRRAWAMQHVAMVSAVAFARAGQDVVSGAMDGSLVFMRDGTTSVLPSAPREVDAVGLLPDGRVIAADARGRLRVMTTSGTVVADLHTSARVGLLRSSSDGRKLVTVPVAGSTSAPELWDLDRYRVIGRLDGHLGRVFGARWVADDRLLTAGGDGMVRMWDGHGRLVQNYRGGQRISDAVLSPSGSFVVSGDSEGRVHYWDAVSGRALWSTQAHTSAIVGLHFEGAALITRGFGGELSRWILDETCARCDIVAP